MIAYAYKDMKSAEMMLNLYFFSIKGFFIATPNTFRVKKSVFINKGNNNNNLAKGKSKLISI